MSKLSRIILGAVVVTAISPVLALTPATAATTVTGTGVTATGVTATTVTATTVTATTNGLCRLFPKLCARVAFSVGGTAT